MRKNLIQSWNIGNRMTVSSLFDSLPRSHKQGNKFVAGKPDQANIQRSAWRSLESADKPHQEAVGLIHEIPGIFPQNA